jgi:amino acid adenylation domain-containing protein
MNDSFPQSITQANAISQQTSESQLLTAELLRLPMVRDAVVVVLPNHQLQAFIVPAQPEVRGVAEAIVESLSSRLQPNHITLLTALPRDHNGIVDRQLLSSLPVLSDEVATQAENYARSQDGIAAAAVLKRSDPQISESILVSELIPSGFGERAVSGLQHRRGAEALSRREHTSPEWPELNSSATTRWSLTSGVTLLPEVEAPVSVAHMLRRAAAGEHGITYVERWSNNPQTDAITSSYAILLRDAERVMAGLRAQGLQPQQRVLVQLERNQDFVTLFWACMLGGFVPVPLAIPPSYRENSSALSRLRNAWDMLGQPFIVTSSAAVAELSTPSAVLGMAGVRVLDISALNRSSPDQSEASWHVAKPDDIAILLLTSGSTGKPKAVIQTNRSLCAFAAAARQEIRITPSDVSLNWMPLDHVGGLVMFHLRDVYSACHQVLVPTPIVLEDPLRWLTVIDRYRASLTWSPNFGYALVADQAARIAESTWDLSCMRFMLNGGEAVVARTVRRFLALLAPHGLPDTAVHPAWGMSETSSGVTYSQRCSRMTITDEMPCVEVGGPMPGISLRIVDEKNQVVPEGRTGRLQVCGPCITPGYFQHDEANKESFTADGWFITGDLGVICDGRLTITGREKDVIIINGINLIAHEIEAVVEEVSGVATSFAAACAVRENNADTDSLAVFFSPAEEESEPFDRDLLGETLLELRTRLTQSLGLVPDYVIPVARSEIPKTGIGKIQRAELRRRFEQGAYVQSLATVERVLRSTKTLPAWFMEPCWRRTELNAAQCDIGVAHDQVAKAEVVLVIHDEDGLGNQLTQELKALGAQVISCRQASIFDMHQDDFQIDMNQPELLAQMFTEIHRRGVRISKVVYLGGYAPLGSRPNNPNAFAQASNTYVCQILHVVQALAQAQPNEAASILLVTRFACAVMSGEDVACERSGVLGLAITISHDYPAWSCRHVDVDQDAAPAACSLIAELQQINSARNSDKSVAYRQHARFVAGFSPLHLLSASVKPFPIHPGDLVLLTGGLGGIGRLVCRWLLQDCQARVLVCGRTVASEATASERYIELMALGDLSYAAIDLVDEQALKVVVTAYEQRYGQSIASVFHLAGAYREKSLSEESVSGIASLVVAKSSGTWALHQLLESRPKALLVGFSSVVSTLGGAATGAYAVANRLLEAVVEHRLAQQRPTYWFAWSMWEDTGMSRGYQRASALAANGIARMSPEQGILSLRAALSRGPQRQIIGLDSSYPFIRLAGGLSSSLERLHGFCSGTWNAVDQLRQQVFKDECERIIPLTWSRSRSLPQTATGEVDREQILTRNRPRGARVAPRDELERDLLDLWRTGLRDDTLGITDDFFASGGASLLASRLVAQIRERWRVELPFRVLFESPTVATLAERVRTALNSTAITVADDLVAISREKELPLSFGQQRLWFIEHMDPGNPIYAITASMRFDQGIDPHTLSEILSLIVGRHEALRCRFAIVEGKPQHLIEPQLKLNIPVINRQSLSLSAGEQAAVGLAEQQARLPFDLTSGPLLRAQVLQLNGGVTILQLCIHHIVADGWSLRVLFDEIAECCRAQRVGEVPLLPPLAIQYVDYAAWQQNYVSGERRERQLNYWRNHLAGCERGLELPTDYLRPAVRRFRGRKPRFAISAQITERIRAFAQREQTTLYPVLLAGYLTLLSRYAQKGDVTIGTVIAGRDRAALEPLIGYFVNVLMIRVDFSDDPHVRTLVQRVHNTSIEAYKHHDLPFEVLVELLQPERSLSHSPLFQIAFDLRDPELYRQRLAGTSIGVMESDLGTAKFDLHLSVDERDGGLVTTWEYDSDLFNPETIARLAANYAVVLEAMTEDRNCRMSQLPLLTQPERDQVLKQWNQHDQTVEPQCLHHLFHRQVLRHPDLISVSGDQRQWTYRELSQRVQRIAKQLQRRGVGPDILVGVCLKRTPEWIAAVLGIMQAGGAYVPLDPAYPASRLAGMIADARPPIIISESDLRERLPNSSSEIVDVHELLANHEELPPLVNTVDSHNLAYVIFTSGSTGKPKGVLVEHHGLATVAFEQQRSYGLVPGTRVLQFASPSFDASIFEMVMAFASGGALHLGSEDELLPGPALARMLADQAIEVVTLAPAALAALSETSLPALRVITVAGDVCPAELVNRWAPGRRFYNLYGPTETTIWATQYRCVVGEMSPPIGWPIANFRIYLLDAQRQLVPLGMPGELYIGGIGVARGYLYRAELTKERFVPDPFKPGQRLYRTGDVGRYRSDGAIEFLGRVDQQVKLRGFRIELGEIENALRRHATVLDAVVVLRPVAGEQTIVAYVCPQLGQQANSEDLRAHLRNEVPAFMVPSHVVVLAVLPLTPNGKVDRAALPDVAMSRLPVGTVPQGEVETQIARIWQDILCIEHVDVHANFFDLGGHSLKMAQVHARLSEVLGRAISVVDLFRFPTVAQLAAHLNRDGNTSGGKAIASIPVPIPVSPAVGANRMALLAQRQLAARRQSSQTGENKKG